MIQSLLTRRFDLTADEFVRLMAGGRGTEQADGAIAWPHFRHQRHHGHGAARVELIGMLWDVAYADGTLHPDEDLLIRRIAGLISVGDRDRVIARKQAQSRREGEERSSGA